MKKKYTTPMIAVEKYELTQAIAACDIKIGFASSDCVLNDPDSSDIMKNYAMSKTFLEGYCIRAGNNMVDSDGICYHTSITTAFTS